MMSKLMIVFSFIIVVLLIVVHRRSCIDNFENKAYDLVKREHGIPVGNDSKIVISERMKDGIPKNTTVDSECRKVKVWFYKQTDIGSDIFTLNSDDYSILTIGRKDDLHCIPYNSTAAIIEDIKSRDKVVKRDVIKYEDENHLFRGYDLDPANLFEDTLLREYCAFFIGKDDIDTESRKFDIQEELNDENSPIHFFGAPVKLTYYRDMGMGRYVGIGSTFCKVAIQKEVDEKNRIKLHDSKYERFFKRLDKNIYEIVYKNSMTKEYVGLNGVSSMSDFRKKYCVMDCSKLSSKQNLWRLKDNVFRRTNFVDIVANQTKSHCDQTSDGKGKIIPTTHSSIYREQDIDLERYKKNELKDIYVIRFEYNSDDFYYVRGDPKFQIPTTKCDVGYTYETVKLKRKYIDKKRWINVEDRKCADVNPCDRVFFDDLKFVLKKQFTLDPYKYSTVDVMKAPEIKDYMNCLGIKITCNLALRPLEEVAVINPQLIIRKRNKEIVLRVKLLEDGQKSLEFGKERDSMEPPNTVSCAGGAYPGSSNNLYVHDEVDKTLLPYESDLAALSWHPTWKKDVQSITCDDKVLGSKIEEKIKLGFMMSNIEEGDDEYSFKPFDVFKNDEFEFLVKSGSVSVEISDLQIIMKCQHPEIITSKAEYSSNNTCSIQNYQECDYDKMFYDPTKSFQCNEYTTPEAGCPSSRTSITDQRLCEITEKYLKSSQEDLETLHYDEMPLNQDFNECQKICDARPGCTGIDYRQDVRECVFLGYETFRVIFTGEDENATRKVTVLYDNDKKRETDVGDFNVMTFTKPVHINSIEVIGGSFKDIEFRGYDGSTQKKYDSNALKRYQHTDQYMLIDDIYNVNEVSIAQMDVQNDAKSIDPS